MRLVCMNERGRERDALVEMVGQHRVALLPPVEFAEEP